METTPNHDFPIVEKVASLLGDTLASAPDDTTRAQIVEVANGELEDAQVRVVDLAPHAQERQGVRTGLTREQLLDRIAVVDRVKKVRAARALGRRAL
jgi:hypothetical protein